GGIGRGGGFGEVSKAKIAVNDSGIFMVGGGVPKNFTQDVVVAADSLGKEVPMHRYAIQLTVADERDGALSGSTLREANSWGKIDLAQEQMVFGELRFSLPLVAGYAYHKGSWRNRTPREFAQLFEQRLVATQNTF